MSEKLKILFVRTAMTYGGADRITLNILKDFDRTKYSCDLALVKNKGEYLKEIPNDIKVIDLKAVNSFLSFFPLTKLLRNKDYDVIYSTCGGTNASAIVAAKLSRKKIKSVVSERNVMLPPGKNIIKRFLQHRFKQFTYPKADYVTVVSRALVGEIIKETKVQQEKIRLLHNPVINNDLLSQKEEYLDNQYFNTSIPVVLAVGRFVYQKDYPTLLSAFQKVLEQTPAWLFILGTGPMENELKKLVQKMGIKERVIFGGFEINPFKFMKNCTVFVLSSKHEGMPGVLIQAMACGAPVIATDCPTGPAEVIEEGKNGYLVPVGNYEKMAEKIVALLQNEDIREKFVANSAEKIKPFYYKTAIESYFEFLRN